MYDTSDQFDLPLPALDRAAVFLDFDGVLVNLAPSPDAVAVPSELPEIISDIARCTGGALAIVTGRSLTDIRTHLSAAPAWIAGSHGGERSTPDGDDMHPMMGSPIVASLQRSVEGLRELASGVVIEMKPLGAVLHYRGAPDMQVALHRTAELLTSIFSEFELHEAKMAYELRPKDVGKDRVVQDWMDREPFVARVPVYFGDDLTDEPAMAVVQAAGGVAVKVGPGESVAENRVDGPEDVLRILGRWLEPAHA